MPEQETRAPPQTQAKQPKDDSGFFTAPPAAKAAQGGEGGAPQQGKKKPKKESGLPPEERKAAIKAGGEELEYAVYMQRKGIPYSPPSDRAYDSFYPASEKYSQAAAGISDKPVEWSSGTGKKKVKDLGTAIRAMDEAHRTNRENSDVLSNLGFCQFNMGVACFAAEDGLANPMAMLPLGIFNVASEDPKLDKAYGEAGYDAAELRKAGTSHLMDAAANMEKALLLTDPSMETRQAVLLNNWLGTAYANLAKAADIEGNLSLAKYCLANAEKKFAAADAKYNEVAKDGSFEVKATGQESYWGYFLDDRRPVFEKRGDGGGQVSVEISSDRETSREYAKRMVAELKEKLGG